LARERRWVHCTVALGLAALLSGGSLLAQNTGKQPGTRAVAAQKIDAEYTAKIKEYTQDPRIITELVDHLPASDKVPVPGKLTGHIPGTPDELTYYKDIKAYFEALAKAAPGRTKLFTIGKTEEGRDMFVMAIADEATIKSLDKYKKILADLTDPRKLTEAQAKPLIAAGKPIYWATANLHSGEIGSSEMEMELAYRLIVEETPFIQNIRNNVIVFLTPVIEPDGHDKVVDRFYYGKKNPGRSMPLLYWGQYVAHDNNRDGLGLGLNLTRSVLKTFLEWHPTVLHDLHESQDYLYASTGAGPYNVAVDPVQTDEWWMIAKHEVSEMTKRGVPGVWTGTFYDGWTPNYLFWIANIHNAIGRFYETESYGPQNRTLNLNASKEWYRPNPPLATIKWGPRNNVNIQESALLLALQYTARNRDLLLENYYLKNKRAIELGKNEAPNAWVIPAGQRRRGEAASFVNLLRAEGVEVHTANAAFTAGKVQVAPGDYVVRMDQPYSRCALQFLDTQFFSPANPSPYDDTGWAIPLLRNVRVSKIEDKSVLDQPMTLLASDAVVPGTITGTGNVVIVDHNGDTTIAPFRFANRDVKMLAAEEPFEAAGRKFTAGALIVPAADRATLEASVKQFGLAAYAVGSVPTVKTHELVAPRIGYVHSWSNTQNEGWVRMAFDKYKIPYTYMGDTKLRDPNLRQKFDVIIFPHVGGTAESQVNGVQGAEAIPYKKTDLTPYTGVQDSADDIRGGMGFEGLINLMKFVQDGGLLITEGSTSTIFPDYHLVTGVTVEQPTGLFARGVVLKSVFADRTSPIAYGYDSDNLAIYFSQAPILNAGGGGFGGGFGGGGRGGGQIPGVGMNLSPQATRPTLTTLDGPPPTAAPAGGRGGRGGAAAGAAEAFAGRGGGRGGAGAAATVGRPRVILRFPTDANDMLLSGGLVGQEALVGRAVVVDSPLGKGHVVMFANRPFWRYQTFGSFNLAFNAILNWNHLDAGQAAAARTTTNEQ
jgi:hypothetical protein